MRKVRDVLRLKHTLGMSFRQISEATGVGKTVVGEYLRRAGVLGITWPVPEAVDDAELERRLFLVPGETAAPRAAIDWRQVHEEMKRRSMTLVLLWQSAQDFCLPPSLRVVGPRLPGPAAEGGSHARCFRFLRQRRHPCRDERGRGDPRIPSGTAAADRCRVSIGY
jgi:hypothetical protein